MVPGEAALASPALSPYLQGHSVLDFPFACDPQKLHFQSKLVPADLLTLANDVEELHATAR